MALTPVCVSEILLAHSLTIHLSVQATVVGLGNCTSPLCPAIPKILSTWVIVKVCWLLITMVNQIHEHS